MTKPSLFEFSQFLSVEEQRDLGDPLRWGWISSCGLLTERVVRHPKHEKWATIPGNTHAPGHREIMLMLRGEAIYSYRGKCYMRRPGTVILLDRGEVRDLKGAPEKSSFSCLWLHLYNRDCLTYYINSCDAEGCYSHALPMRVKTGEASRLISDAWDQCKVAPDDLFCRQLLRSLVVSTFLRILGEADPLRPVDHHEAVVESLKEYIAGHIAEDLSLKHLASLAGYSPFFFHRLFQQHTGKTPVQYVNAVRLAKAVDQLHQGYKVEAAAYSVGFSSVSYFNAFFKKALGVTPGKWRRGKRKEEKLEKAR